MAEPVVYFAWEAPPEARAYRSKTWWIVAGVIAIAVFVYSIYTANFAFTLIILMFALISLIARRDDSKSIEIVIAEQGILVSRTLYSYSNIREFYILDADRVLYFFPTGILTTHIHVKVPDDVDMNELRVVLKGHVSENEGQKTEPVTDTISKKLKLF